MTSALRRACLASVICAILLIPAVPALAQPTLGSDYEIAYTEKHPLSSASSLKERLNESALDYDLSKERFIVYVPKTYTPDTPHGIVYYMGYKQTLSSAPKWHAILEKSKLIFIAVREFEQPAWQRMGVALDAVHNLSKQYTIDKSRVYLFGYPGSTVAQKLALGTGDVFTGAALIVNFQLFRPARDARGTYNPDFAPPPAAVVANAKGQRIVLVVHPQNRQQNRPRLAMQNYQESGFKDVLRIDLEDPEDIHYPNMAEAWFQQSIDFMDQPRTTPPQRSAAPALAAPTATPSSATPAAPAPAPAGPATRPAIQPPQQLLSLAKSYIAARSYAGARTRLQEIITKYPNDPAAREARTLLEQIKDR